MIIVSISTTDPSDPVEVQNWLDKNPGVNIFNILVQSNLFYIFYT